MSRVPNVETKAIHFRTKILDSAYYNFYFVIILVGSITNPSNLSR